MSEEIAQLRGSIPTIHMVRHLRCFPALRRRSCYLRRAESLRQKQDSLVLLTRGTISSAGEHHDGRGHR